MVHQAREQNLDYGWIGMDSLYGTNIKLTNALEDLGEKFMGDVHRTVKIWDTCPGLKSLIQMPNPEGKDVPANSLVFIQKTPRTISKSKITVLNTLPKVIAASATAKATKVSFGGGFG